MKDILFYSPQNDLSRIKNSASQLQSENSKVELTIILSQIQKTHPIEVLSIFPIALFSLNDIYGGYDERVYWSVPTRPPR